jgi:hypothetical protein
MPTRSRHSAPEAPSSKRSESRLKGSRLDIRERATALVIRNPCDPDKGHIHIHIHINYTTADVTHRRTTWSYLGPLKGYEPNDDPDREPSVNADTIIAALTDTQPPSPAL